jgi:hypothetical protein
MHRHANQGLPGYPGMGRVAASQSALPLFKAYPKIFFGHALEGRLSGFFVFGILRSHGLAKAGAIARILSKSAYSIILGPHAH